MRDQKNETGKPAVFPLSKEQRETLKSLTELHLEAIPFDLHPLQARYIGLVVNQSHLSNALPDQMLELVKIMNLLLQLAPSPGGVDLYLDDISQAGLTLLGQYKMLDTIHRAPVLVTP